MRRRKTIKYLRRVQVLWVDRNRGYYEGYRNAGDYNAIYDNAYKTLLSFLGRLGPSLKDEKNVAGFVGGAIRR
jgi:hypothetical protein